MVVVQAEIRTGHWENRTKSKVLLLEVTSSSRFSGSRRLTKVRHRTILRCTHTVNTIPSTFSVLFSNNTFLVMFKFSTWTLTLKFRFIIRSAFLSYFSLSKRMLHTSPIRSDVISSSNITKCNIEVLQYLTFSSL